MLCSNGLCIVQVLAKKMTVLYKLSKEQLSSQHHYDFGLRALKSVLVMAGSLKRSSPDMSEALVLMRALRDMNLPKFVYDDVPLFLGLINDLFPGENSFTLWTLLHVPCFAVPAGQEALMELHVSELDPYAWLCCASALRSLGMLACAWTTLQNKTVQSVACLLLHSV